MKTRFLVLPVLAILLAASFLIAAQLPGHAAAQASPLPGPASPLPHPDSKGDNQVANIAEGNSYVVLPFTMGGGNLALRLQTHQIGVGWWNACGKLAVTLSVNGYADIPAGAQEISIPHDILGRFNVPGWKKAMRPDGEWVLRRTTATCPCTDSEPVCR